MAFRCWGVSTWPVSSEYKARTCVSPPGTGREGWWGPLPEGHNNNRQDILTIHSVGFMARQDTAWWHFFLLHVVMFAIQFVLQEPSVVVTLHWILDFIQESLLFHYNSYCSYTEAQKSSKKVCCYLQFYVQFLIVLHSCKFWGVNAQEDKAVFASQNRTLNATAVSCVSLFGLFK